MADGQHAKVRTGAIIQARMRSTRLPGKILLPLPYPQGKPLLQWVVEGARRCAHIAETILATSVNPENDPLQPFSARHKLTFFRGSEDDVLSRFQATTRAHQLDHIVRLTGDNPLIDSALLDNLIDRHITQGNDYTKTTGLPLGMNMEIASAKALLNLPEAKLTPDDREHVTLYIVKSPDYKKEVVNLFPERAYAGIRLTVDYPSDFSALSMILALWDQQEPVMTFLERLTQSHPWIFEINAHHKQRQQFKTAAEEIRAAMEILHDAGLKQAVTILEKNG